MSQLFKSFTIILMLVPTITLAEFQSDPPRLRFFASEPCQIIIDGKESSKFNGGNESLIRITKGSKTIECRSNNGETKKTIVDAKENTDTFVYFEFGYMDRFAQYEDVIIDAWTSYIWEAKVSDKEYTFKEAKKYCENKKSKFYGEWGVPSMSKMSHLLAESDKNIGKCGNESCSIHPIFNVNGVEFWTREANVFNMVTGEYYPVDYDDNENIKKKVICRSDLILREPLKIKEVL